jgi:hypothetical protein
MFSAQRLVGLFLIMQGDKKVSVHLMFTEQKAGKNILNSFNHLP